MKLKGGFWCKLFLIVAGPIFLLSCGKIKTSSPAEDAPSQKIPEKPKSKPAEKPVEPGRPSTKSDSLSPPVAEQPKPGLSEPEETRAPNPSPPEEPNIKFCEQELEDDNLLLRVFLQRFIDKIESGSALSDDERYALGTNCEEFFKKWPSEKFFECRVNKATYIYKRSDTQAMCDKIAKG